MPHWSDPRFLIQQDLHPEVGAPGAARADEPRLIFARRRLRLQQAELSMGARRQPVLGRWPSGLEGILSLQRRQDQFLGSHEQSTVDPPPSPPQPAIEARGPARFNHRAAT
jgi:hypothetical protein